MINYDFDCKKDTEESKYSRPSNCKTKKRAVARDNCSLNFEKDKVQRLKSKSQFISKNKDTKKSLEINIM